MKRLGILIVFCFQMGLLSAQSEIIAITGKVSYLTTTNAYVKFSNTSVVNVGDTLFIGESGMPALIVTAKSSTTVVGSIIKGVSVKKGQGITHFSIKAKPKSKKKKAVVAVVPTVVKANNNAVAEEKPADKTKVSGRVTLANYSNFGLSSKTANHRQFVALALNVKNMGSPQLSARFYGNYSLINPSEPSVNQNSTSLFKVFNALVNYEFKSGGHINLGRDYNRKLSSVGSSDGVQFEKNIKQFYVGALAGFRPNLATFGINTSLFQYGAYAGFQSRKKFISTTTLGYIEQYNTGVLDRRYGTLQHNSQWGKLRFFVSSELELYNPTVNQLRLSGFYFSTNYRINKKASAMLSYDTRKAIVFYQSKYSNITNVLGTEDVGRQGLRFRFNYNFTPKLYTGVSANYRFQSNNINASYNYYGFISYNKVPLIGGKATLSFSINSSITLNSQIPSLRYSKSFINNKLQVYLNYRFLRYAYARWDIPKVYNHFVGLGSTYRISNRFNLNLFGEYSNTSSGDYMRINISFTAKI